jgi:hypothetical protein
MRILGITLSLAFAAAPIFADSLVANLTTPYIPNGPYVDVSSAPLGSSASITGIGYTIDFLGVDPDAGVVDSALGGKYAVPITGNGSPWSGNYLSASPYSSIKISFTNPQNEITFLWGSVDVYNSLITIGNATTPTYTGQDVAKAVPLTANGNQDFGGSAYVDITTTNPFTSVTFTSTSYAFEFAGVNNVPDGGMTLMLLGGALVGLSTLRRKFRA